MRVTHQQAPLVVLTLSLLFNPVALLGCRSPSDDGASDDGVEVLGHVEAAVTAPQCSDAGLVWPAGAPAESRTCAGQWAVRDYNHPCPGPERQVCRHPDHGIESETTYNTSVTVYGTFTVAYGFPWFTYLNGKNCSAAAADTFNALLPLGKGNATYTLDPGQKSFWGENGFTEVCNMHIQRLPTFFAKATDRCDFAPAYQTCKSPAFGIWYEADQSETLWVSGWYMLIGYLQLPKWTGGVTCQVAAQKRYDELVPPPDRGRSWIEMTEGQITPWGTGFVQPCNFVLHLRPYWNEGTGPACGSRCPGHQGTWGGRDVCLVDGIGPVGSCGVAAQTTYVGAGGVAPSVAVDAFLADAVCVSGDDRSLATVADRQAFFGTLKAEWARVLTPPVGYDAAGNGAAIARKLMLLAELHGEDLAKDQLDFIVPLYASQAASAPACGESAVPAAPGCEANKVASAQAALLLCQHLTAEHVSVVTAAALLPRCTEALADTANLTGASCTPATLIAALSDAARAVTEKVLAVPVQAALAGSDLKLELQRRLALMNAWYVGAAAPYATQGEAGNEPLWRALSSVLAAFWRGVNGNDLDVITATDPQVVDKIDSRREEREQAVLEAAYAIPTGASTLALTGAPLVPLTADALASIHRRLDALASLHDLGCLYRRCAKSAASKQGQMWTLLAALGDGTLAATAAGANEVPSSWKLLFLAIGARQSELDAALTSIMGASAKARLADGPVPAPARDFARLVRGGAQRTASLTQTGFFDAATGTRMSRGITVAELDALAPTGGGGEITTEENALAVRLAKYQNELQTLVQALLDQLRGRQDGASLRARLEQLIRDQSKLEDEIQALRTIEAADALGFADFAGAFQAIVETATDPTAKVVKNTVVRTITPGSATMPYGSGPGLRDPMRKVSVTAYRDGGTPLTIPVHRGDTVNVTVTGKWSPTCALQLWNWGVQKGYSSTLGTVDTGPEGFSITHQNSQYQASGHNSSRTESHSSTTTGSARACGGVAFFGSSAETCIGYQEDWTSSTAEVDTHGQGQESRTTGAFPSGLRLETTPLPYMPVGSLVLAQAPVGEDDLADLTDAWVLQNQSSVVIAEDGNLYLIVNDLGVSECDNLPGALTVTVNVLQPEGRYAKVFAKGLSETLAKVRADTPAYLPRGRLLPSELSTWETFAWNAVDQACIAQLTGEGLSPSEVSAGCSRTALSPILSDFFHAWLARELVHRERMVELAALKRRRDTVLLELEGARQELVHLAEHGRMGSFLASLALRQLGSSELQRATATVVDKLVDDVHPYLRLRFPEGLARLAMDPAFDPLINADIDTPLADLADEVSQAAEAVRVELVYQRTHNPQIGHALVAVSFAKATANPANLVFSAAGPARAKEVWDGLLKDRKATLTIEPGDLWSSGQAAHLFCNEAAPVIRSSWIFLPSNNPADEARNGLNVRATAGVGQAMRFPGADGTTELLMTGTAWLSDNLRVLWGPVQNLDSLQATYGAPAAGLNGRAALNRFFVDLKDLPLPLLQKAEQIVLVMDVEFRPLGTEALHGVGTCP
jgi:hypothetical protein